MLHFPDTQPGISHDRVGVQLGVPNGIGFSHDEQRSHFALWAILKSPLILGTDLTYGDTLGFCRSFNLPSNSICGLHIHIDCIPATFTDSS